jgi:hypothetical protein
LTLSYWLYGGVLQNKTNAEPERKKMEKKDLKYVLSFQRKLSNPCEEHNRFPHIWP